MGRFVKSDLSLPLSFSLSAWRYFAGKVADDDDGGEIFGSTYTHFTFSINIIHFLFLSRI